VVRPTERISCLMAGIGGQTMRRALIVIAGVLLLAAIRSSMVLLALHARRGLQEGRWLAAGLAVAVAVVLLVPALLVVDLIAFALFWES
jgi:hypothetical protein